MGEFHFILCIIALVSLLLSPVSLEEVEVDVFSRFESRYICEGSCCFFEIITKKKDKSFEMRNLLREFFSHLYDDECLLSVLSYLDEVLSEGDRWEEEEMYISAGILDFILETLRKQVLVIKEELGETNITLNKPFLTKYPNSSYVCLRILSSINLVPEEFAESREFINMIDFFLSGGMTFMEQSVASRIISTLSFHHSMVLSYFDEMFNLLLSVYDIVYTNFIQHHNKRFDYHSGLLLYTLREPQEHEQFKNTDESSIPSGYYIPEYEIQDLGFEYGSEWKVWVSAYFNNIFFLPEANMSFILEKFQEVRFIEKVFVDEYSFFLNDYSNQILLPILSFLSKHKEGRNHLFEVSTEEGKISIFDIIGRFYLTSIYGPSVVEIFLNFLDDEELIGKMFSNIEPYLSLTLYDLGKYIPDEEIDPRVKTKERDGNRHVKGRVYEIFLRKFEEEENLRRIIFLEDGKRLKSEIDLVNLFSFEFTEIARENDRNRFLWVSQKLEEFEDENNLEFEETLNTIDKKKMLILKELKRAHNGEFIGLYFYYLYELSYQKKKVILEEVEENEDLIPEFKREIAKLSAEMLKYCSRGIKLNQNLFGLVFKRANLFQKKYNDLAFSLIEMKNLRNRLSMVFQETADYEKIRKEYHFDTHPNRLMMKLNTEIEKIMVRNREVRYYSKYGVPKMGSKLRLQKYEKFDFPSCGRYEGRVCEELFENCDDGEE